MLTGSANGSIKVAETSIRTINAAPVGNVFAQVMLHLSPTPRICIEIDSVQLPSDFDESAGAFDISLDSGATFSVRPDLVRFERTKDKLLCKGSFTLVNGSVTPIQPVDELTEVQFGLLGGRRLTSQRSWERNINLLIPSKNLRGAIRGVILSN